MDQVEIKQLNDYAMTKWVGEMQVMNSAAMHGTESVRVRLFNTYGPGEYYSPYRSVICLFAYSALLDRPYTVYLGHHRTSSYIDDTVRNIRGNVGYAQPPLLFLNDGRGAFRDVAGDVGRGFVQPRVGRGLAIGDFDNDGDADVLMTTNNGPAVLFRNDRASGNRSIRFRLVGTTSNRDAIGATVRIFHGGTSQMRMVRTGSSYLSQSELPVTFGVGQRDRIDRVEITWPRGRTEEFRSLVTGRRYRCVEGQGITEG